MAQQEHTSLSIRGLATDSGSFAAAAATVDLTTVALKPAHAAQVVDFFNANTTTTENAVWKDLNAVVHTTPIAPLGRYTPPIPVSEITGTTGDNVSADVYWWLALGAARNGA